MDIVVLAGGLSTERDVSFVSGGQVTKALKENGHRVIMLDVFMGYGDDEQDVTGIFDQADQITEAAGTLGAGAKELKGSSKALNDGAQALAEGMNELPETNVGAELERYWEKSEGMDDAYIYFGWTAQLAGS